MSWMVDRLYELLGRYVTIPQEEESVYRYGIDLFVYTCLSTLGLVLMGCLLGMTGHTVIIIAICYLNQTFGGGSHANTHLKCFLVMVIGLLVGLGVCYLFEESRILIGLGIFAGMILIASPVVLHRNKNYLQKNIPKYNRRMRLIVLAELLFLLMVHQMEWNVIGISISVGLVLSALSRTTALVLKRVENRKRIDAPKMT